MTLSPLQYAVITVHSSAQPQAVSGRQLLLTNDTTTDKIIATQEKLANADLHVIIQILVK